MNMLVSTAAIATAMPVAAAEPDPIFAAIERHRSACAAFSAYALRQDDLEGRIPHAKRQSDVRYVEGLNVVDGDDPEWIDFQRSYEACWNEETQSAIDLVSSENLTLPGALALLRYAMEAETKDSLVWPADLEDDDGKSRPWHYFLMELVAGALAKPAL